MSNGMRKELLIAALWASVAVAMGCWGQTLAAVVAGYEAWVWFAEAPSASGGLPTR